MPPRILVVAATVALAGCGATSYVRAPERTVDPALWPAGRITSHVVAISIDGLRPDAIDAFGAVTLQRLSRDGSFTYAARTVLPSKTLPSHTSMLTGQPPDYHGVLWNAASEAPVDVIEHPTVFGLARARGYRTAAFFSKSKFQPLQQPGALDYSQAPGGWFGQWTSERTAADVAHYLGTARPNLLFVHLADVDTDAAVWRVLSAADRAYGADGYTVLVTADHGGHDRDHGSDDPRDVAIPWIAWGRGVMPGPLTAIDVQTMDTASTIAWLLGLEEPANWAGVPIADAFVRPAARLAFDTRPTTQP
jgi:arylsulfatase A-like enzyme